MDTTWLQKAVCQICWTWRISCLFPQRQHCTFVMKSFVSPSTITDTPVLLSSLSVKRKYVQRYPGKRLNILSSTEIRLCMHAFIQLMTSNWAHNYSSPEDNITQNNKMQLINNTGKVLKSKLNARLQKKKKCQGESECPSVVPKDISLGRASHKWCFKTETAFSLTVTHFV